MIPILDPRSSILFRVSHIFLYLPSAAFPSVSRRIFRWLRDTGSLIPFDNPAIKAPCPDRDSSTR